MLVCKECISCKLITSHQPGMGSGINPADIPMQRGVLQQAHQQQQMRRKDQMGMPGYPPRAERNDASTGEPSAARNEASHHNLHADDITTRSTLLSTSILLPP
ncbi:hypothetical protein RYX36_005883 [Vicia faba]